MLFSDTFYVLGRASRSPNFFQYMRFHKVLYLLFCCFIIFIFTYCQQQNKYTYFIKINVPKGTDCKSMLLSPNLEQINSSTYIRGNLILTGNITQPGVYLIKIIDNSKYLPFIRVYLPADSIHICIIADSILYRKYYRLYHGLGAGSYLTRVKVTSTSFKQKELEDYLLLRDSVWNKAFSDKDLLEAKMIESFNLHNKYLDEVLADSVRNFNIKGYMASAADVFIKKHPQSDIALYALNDVLYKGSIRRFYSYYIAMPDSLRNSMYGIQLRKKINEYKN